MSLSASICLATCNGEAYIEPLLQSITNQQRLPLELVVNDDASEDATVAIIERFSPHAPFPVRLRRNPERLGVIANFEKAIQRASGDVIFPCDQDDVWLPHKLTRMVALLEDRPGVLGVFSDSFLIGSSGDRLGATLWSSLHSRAIDRAALGEGRGLIELVTRPCAPGHALAFRSSARDLVLPFSHSCLHDMWISRLLAGVGGLIALEEPLVEYRLHRANAVGTDASLRRAFATGSWTPRRQWAEEANATEELIARLHERAPGSLHSSDEAALRERATHLTCRWQLPSGHMRRLGPITAELLSGRYSRFSNGLRSVGLDLLRRVE